MIIAGIIIWNLFKNHYRLTKVNKDETLKRLLDLNGNLVLQGINNNEYK
jgi:hypothetical protein